MVKAGEPKSLCRILEVLLSITIVMESFLSPNSGGLQTSRVLEISWNHRIRAWTGWCERSFPIEWFCDSLSDWKGIPVQGGAEQGTEPQPQDYQCLHHYAGIFLGRISQICTMGDSVGRGVRRWWHRNSEKWGMPSTECLPTGDPITIPIPDSPSQNQGTAGIGAGIKRAPIWIRDGSRALVLFPFLTYPGKLFPKICQSELSGSLHLWWSLRIS